MTAPNIIPLPEPKPVRKFAARKFKHLGQNWRLFKRSADPDAPWYFYFERDKQRFGPTSMQTWIASLAEENAKKAIDLFYAQKKDAFDSAMGRKTNKFATLADIFAIMPELAIRATKRGRESYIWSVRWVLRRALNLANDVDVDKLCCDVLNAATARAFFVSVLTESNTLPSQGERNKFKRTALQIFGFAKALVSPVATESMRVDFKLALPSFEEFRKASKVGYAMLNPGDASEFHAPDDATLRRALVEWVRLGKTPGYIIPVGALSANKVYAGKPLPDWLRRNIFIAIGLELSCGLRKSEVSKARWRWFQTQNGAPRLSEQNVDVKNASNTISVRPVDPYWHILNDIVDRNGWRGKPDEFCLMQREQVKGDYRALNFKQGGHCDRTYWPFLLIGYWLRWIGFKTQKTNHALRDWTASRITMKYGLERASRWCRHGQIATTEAHYSRFVNDEDMDDPKRLRWFRWAK